MDLGVERGEDEVVRVVERGAVVDAVAPVHDAVARALAERHLQLALGLLVQAPLVPETRELVQPPSTFLDLLGSKLA